MLRANRPILAFFDAIKNLRVRQVALILKAGYEPNLLVNSRGQNGLQFMIGHFGATEAHFRLQAPINKSAYLSIAKLLLNSGLDPNTLDLLTDETVLFDAIRYNDCEMVALLLNYVDLSLRNKNGETALMCAARFGSKQVVRLLLEHLRHLEMDGYFLRQRNRFGMTALELARVENLDAAKVLTKHLIAYGHHTGAVLARSTSHHQLLAANRHLPPPPASGVALAGPSGAHSSSRGRRNVPPRPVMLDEFDLSASDYDSDPLDCVGTPAMGVGARPLGAPHHAYSRQLAAAYYDPKAAEFNRYLLEQQQGLRVSSERQQQQRGIISDDELDFESTGAGGGQLVRSRSCMLGPAATSSGSQGPSAKQAAGQAGGGRQKYAVPKRQGVGGDSGGKLAGDNWQQETGTASGGL